jgi:hypothetical protein
VNLPNLIQLIYETAKSMEQDDYVLSDEPPRLWLLERVCANQLPRAARSAMGDDLADVIRFEAWRCSERPYRDLATMQLPELQGMVAKEVVFHEKRDIWPSSTDRHRRKKYFQRSLKKAAAEVRSEWIERVEAARRSLLDSSYP